SSYKSSVDFINLITLMGFLPHVKTLMSEWVGALGDSNEYMPYLDQYHESKDPASLEKMFEFQDVFKVRGDVYSGTLKKLAIFANSLINIALWGLFVLTTGIVIIIALVITRSITKPLKIITHTANEIAKGDLSITEFDISNRDEIGILANTFNDMIYSLKLKADLLERIADGDLSININLTSEADLLGMSLIKMKDSLNRTLGQVVSTVDQVASGTEEIAASSQSLSKGAFEQASAIEQIATLLNEINKRANDNADSALKANNIAIKAKQYAETGNSQMEDLVKAMSDISISSDNIKKIVKTIDDIAFQINLLSINANIEAARAGKYGRGFAVVADEVRELANRSAESVKETNILVEQSLENIVEGNKFVKTTAHQLLEIVNGSSQVEKLVAEIVSVSNNQSKGLLEITKGIDQIDTVTQSNSSSAEESAASCEQLSSQAQLLKTMVSDFKLEVIERQRIKQQF
ncbi:MAG: HAMP domain-containing protein, partial [Deltaproteobacteria bacterium]|nr:HAMP domain-containing protein [Deltaproteobacteria bacterium]